MDVRFLTPLGAAFALTMLLPLAVLALRERRARRVRSTLGLAEMQPIVETTRSLDERTDAEVFVVADVSRSMLASAKAGAPTRLARAQAHAGELGAQLPGVRVG